MSNGNGSQLLVVGDTGGITVIDPSTPLRRLNYFDGKYLRAADFDVEQGYLRHLVALSNQGLGPGVVYGYDTALGSGDTVQIGPGLAIDPYGKVLLLQSSVALSIQAIIDATKKIAPQAPDASGKTGPGVFNDCVEIAAPPPKSVVPVSDIYVIAICSAEALCGQQDVYGVMCQDACVTSADRPYRLDGVVVRAIPLQLVTPFPTSTAVSIGANLYLRSKVAHSWFADEVLKHPHAVSRDGLLSTTWCLGAGYASGCCEVPLAVVARAGATTIFLDTWIVRRERMEAPAKRYWQWRMRMRPWDVFLAQILQFQCQLADVLSGIVTPGSHACDPCAPAHEAVNEAAQILEQASLLDHPTLLLQISNLKEKLQQVLKTAGVPAQLKNRILIQAGILELPSAGYLPVVNGTSVSVNDQVRALLGEGLDLRFCITTVDYVAHAIEEAQHMDRISLLQGIDDPSHKPHVDILVPDGVIASSTVKPNASLYDAIAAFSTRQTGGLVYKGAAREEALSSGGTALHTAVVGLRERMTFKDDILIGLFSGTSKITANLETNLFTKNEKTDWTAAENLISDEVKEAQSIISGGSSAGSATSGPPPPPIVDGMWLTARVDQRIKSLEKDGQTKASLRILSGNLDTRPTAVELAFNGTLSVKDVQTTAAKLVLAGSLEGNLSLKRIAKASDQSTTKSLLTKPKWEAEFTCSSDDANGPIKLDLTVAPDVHLSITRAFNGNGTSVKYLLSLLDAKTEKTSDLGELDLTADAGVVNPGNTYHRYADNGLDLIQAPLIVNEPSFKPNAEALLFPAPPAPTQGLDIQAVRDWVAFTRRREKQCHLEVVPTPIPPRSYRVINLKEQSSETADVWVKVLQNQANLGKLINSELKKTGGKLIVKFAGGSATAQSDLKAAEAAWKAFGPGSTIYYAAIGAAGENDATLQLKRLKTFENAISADSKVVPSTTKEAAITPYPPDAVPPDADGVMLFVTVAAVVRNALLIHAAVDDGDHMIDLAQSHNSRMEFHNNAPTGDALQKFIDGLTANSVRGVTLATTKVEPDDGAAKVRLDAVIQALDDAGKNKTTSDRQVTQVLGLKDHDRLINAGIVLANFDDVIFFEPNP